MKRNSADDGPLTTRGAEDASALDEAVRILYELAPLPLLAVLRSGRSPRHRLLVQQVLHRRPRYWTCLARALVVDLQIARQATEQDCFGYADDS